MVGSGDSRVDIACFKQTIISFLSGCQVFCYTRWMLTCLQVSTFLCLLQKESIWQSDCAWQKVKWVDLPHVDSTVLRNCFSWQSCSSVVSTMCFSFLASPEGWTLIDYESCSGFFWGWDIVWYLLTVQWYWFTELPPRSCSSFLPQLRQSVRELPFNFSMKKTKLI